MRLLAIFKLILFAVCLFSACRKSRDALSVAAPSLSEKAPSPIIIPANADRVPPTLKVTPAFVDVAKSVGVDFTYFNDEVEGRYFLPEVMGGGAAWLDYDQDGELDLYLVNGESLSTPNPNQTTHLNALYRGDGSRFENVAALAGASQGGGFGQGCCVGDFNADGFPDIYVCNFGRNRMLKNNGDGTFSDVTDEAGVGDPLWSTSATFLDLNDDGVLDLFVVNYLETTIDDVKVCQYEGKPGYCGPGAHQALPDRAYLGNADGTFTESAERLGLNAPNGKGLAVAVVDFDGDSIPEIYVANDMAEDFLYRRIGSGSELRYENLGNASGVSVGGNGRLVASMGLSCSDFDGDGRVDIFVTNYYTNGNILFRNIGDLLFVDDSRRTRIAGSSFQNLGFGTIPFDYDWDGDRDLFVANGHVLGPLHEPHTMHPQLLANDGTGLFDEVSAAAGPYFADRWLGRGAASGDYDNDGDIDLVVTHLHRPVALLQNETKTGHHFIGFDLRTLSRLPPLGGRIIVSAGGSKVTVPVVGGGSYLCHSDPRIVIGVGESAGTVDVEIHWPSGRTEQFPQLPVDRYWHISEGGQPRSGSPIPQPSNDIQAP